MKSFFIKVTSTIFLFLSISVYTFANVKSFSAEAVQSAPGMQSTRMNLFVSGDKSVRIEMSTPQGKVIQQYIASSGVMRVLYPDTKEYLEQKSSAPFSMPGEEVLNPCENMPYSNCEKIGDEKVNGQQAVHWKIKRPGRDGKEFIVEQWLDKKRGITLREQLPNGININASMVGSEEVNGRETERWEVIMTAADGKTQTSTRWYDKELGITVREVFPNGSVRELKNIQVRKPDAKLFMLPEGYRKLDVPAQPQRR